MISNSQSFLALRLSISGGSIGNCADLSCIRKNGSIFVVAYLVVLYAKSVGAI